MALGLEIRGLPLEFGILGPLEVRVDGLVVEVGGPKVRTLLAALVVDAGKVVSTDRLLDVLWGPEQPDSAASTLQSHVSHLRDALEPDRSRRRRFGVLLTRDPGYLLAVDADAVDAWRFERLAGEGRRALSAGAPEEARARLGEALALWRGPPLAEFGFETFAQAEIAGLSELRLAATEDRIAADLALGAPIEVVGELRALVGEHPLRERLWGQLMLALYRSGRQAEALRAFAELREVLGEQLGIGPSPELVRLEELVLLQKPELDWHPPPGTGRGPAAIPPEPSAATPRPSEVAAALLVEAGRDAFRRRAWQEAFERLGEAERSAGLPPQDLEELAEAAFWAGHSRDGLDLWQRVHTAHLEGGNRPRAAFAALMVSVHHGLRRRISVAAGWYALAYQLLQEEPEGLEHGYLALADATLLVMLGLGDPASALQSAQRALEVATRFDDRHLRALGLTYQGYVLVHQGQLSEGMALLDEAMATTLTGTLSPFATTSAICRTLSTCVDLHDYRRATEWLDAIDGCPLGGNLAGVVPGDCRMHYAQTLMVRGAWSDAELHARRGCSEMDDFVSEHTGLAFYTVGEILRLRGDLDAAEDAFRRADELGRTPQPGLSLLHLGRGDAHTAAAAIHVAVADTWDLLGRARLLSAQVEITLAAGDADTAREAAAELRRTADRFGSTGLQALSAHADGAVALADGHAAATISSLRRSCQGWREIGATYELARARFLLGTALFADGERASALLELEAAAASFERLGARPDARRAADLGDLARRQHLESESVDGPADC